MERLTTTPFGRRPVTAGLVAAAARAAAPADAPSAPKWELFRNLVTARAAFGVTQRDLTVLNALLSFHRTDDLSDEQTLIVFPSNAALSERAHGMAESTLRRHLAALVEAGLVVRHDSPNGKRYAARGPEGEIVRAFGFDLRPLLVRATEIAQAARAARAAADALRRRREEAVVRLRDCAKLAEYLGIDASTDLDDVRRSLRRRLGREELEAILSRLRDMIRDLEDKATVPESGESSGNDVDSKRHLHNSKPQTTESEPCLEIGTGNDGQPAGGWPGLPLALVLKACPDVELVAGSPVRDWRGLCSAAADARPMLGISPDAWISARQAMGDAVAAITVACILQRADRIRSPGGYLRALTAKAGEGAFSPGPMVMALLNTGTATAA